MRNKWGRTEVFSKTAVRPLFSAAIRQLVVQGLFWLNFGSTPISYLMPPAARPGQDY